MSKPIRPYREGMAIDAPCAVADMPDDIYHADPCPALSLSGTTAFKMVQPGGPALVKNKMDNPEPPKPAMIEGTAAHSVVLGAGKTLIADEYVTEAGRPSSKKEAKEWRAKQAQLGRMVVSPDLFERAVAMKQIAGTHPEAGPLLKGGIPELSIFDYDETAGVWLRGRIDYLRDRKTVVDYKTTTDASPQAFQRHAWNMGYHVQAAHYMRIAKRLGIIDNDATYTLIVQERYAPYRIAVYELDDNLLTEGEIQVQRAIRAWADGVNRNVWPSFPTCVMPLTAPAWAQLADPQELDSAEQAAKEFDELIKENKAA